MKLLSRRVFFPMIILRQTDSPSGPGGSIVQSCRGFFFVGLCSEGDHATIKVQTGL